MQAAIEWPGKLFNPAAAEGDVVMPLPCGGAMVFRRVEIESNNLLDDVQFTVGNTSDDWGYAENPHNTHLAGAFSTPSSARYYLMGKYEVSSLQYKAVMADECPKPNMKGRLPKTSVGWFDAVEFAHRYSLWLRKHAAKLPGEDGEPGFVRLPTEDEWEFAVRGGAVLSPSDFRERIYPMPGGIARHAWYAGTASANGKAQLTGLLKPNPLGLHDMLGNVDEIVLDIFRLNRLDRMHGQAGGFVVRGGNYFTPAEQIRSSYRQETPFYRDGEPQRAKTTGFRVVISAPVITSPGRLQNIARDWSGLGTGKVSTGSSTSGDLDGKTFDDPVAELAAISKSMKNKKMKLRMDRLRDTVRATIEARNRQRNQAARESLRLGGIMCQKLRDDGVATRALRERVEKCPATHGKDNRLCTVWSKKLDNEERVLNDNLGIYAESVMGTAQNYPADILEEQVDLLTKALKKRKFDGLVKYTKLYSEQAGSYADNWRVRRDHWFDSCVGDS